VLNKKKSILSGRWLIIPLNFITIAVVLYMGWVLFFRAGPEISHLSCMQVEKEILPKAAKFQAEIKKQMKLLRLALSGGF
jgi:hypothetical protein